MSEAKNEIVVYQPNETLRLEVQMKDKTVWLTQEQIAELFGTKRPAVTKHLANIYKSGELDEVSTCSILEHMGQSGVQRYRTKYYNLDAILSVGYRVNSINATMFRRWASSVLTQYLLQGVSVNQRMIQMEDRIDRRLAKHEAEITVLRKQVDFFIKTNEQPVQGVFYGGQLWDACSFVEKLIAKAKVSIILIDNWVDAGTLDMLSKKRKNVAVEIVASKRGNKLAATDIAKFNAQYPMVSVRDSVAFHDRFLILDDKELYLIGASLKDLGKKCFGFTKMDASEIAGIKARI